MILNALVERLKRQSKGDHFRVKRPMPRVGGFQAFHTARRTIPGFEALLWLRKGFGFSGPWTVREQTTCSRPASDFSGLTKRRNKADSALSAAYVRVCDRTDPRTAYATCASP